MCKGEGGTYLLIPACEHCFRFLDYVHFTNLHDSVNYFSEGRILNTKF